MEQSVDHDDEVRQFVSELKSRTSSSESRRLTQSVPGRRFATDRKRAGGNLPAAVESSPTSSPRTRRSNAPDRPLPPPPQVSLSPRAARAGRPVDAPLVTDGGSPSQQRRTSAAAAKKPPGGVSSPPTAARGGARAAKTADHPARPPPAKTEPAGPGARSPGSSPRKARTAVTALAAGRLATIDDDQARSTSDSDSLLTHSGGSSDDQDPAASRPPPTPKLARRQHIDMTQMLLAKSASLPDQPHAGGAGATGGATAGVRQVRGSPNTARRAANPRHS